MTQLSRLHLMFITSSLPAGELKETKCDPNQLETSLRVSQRLLLSDDCFVTFISSPSCSSSQAEDEEEEDQPLSLSWPESNRKRFTYLLIIPIVLPLWLTLPDVRKSVRQTRLPAAGTSPVFCGYSDMSFFVSASSCSPRRSSFPSPSWVPSAGLHASPT